MIGDDDAWRDLEEDDEICCGMLVCQIGLDWVACPYCGDLLHQKVLDYVIIKFR